MWNKRAKRENIINVYVDKINYYVFPILKTVVFLFLIGFIIYVTFSWNSENSSKVFHFLETSLWPIIAILFIFSFKKEISTLILKGFQIIFPSGHEVRTGNTIPNQEKQQKDPSPKNIENYEEVRREKEEKIEKDQDVEKLKSDLINTQIYLDFERIYRVVFGSQIDLLKRLRSFGYLGEQLKDTIFFFVLNQRLFPVLVNWTFEQYLIFLFNNGLIITNNYRYFITDKGKAFLTYIEFLNYPNKEL